jgi:hypothetical protein
VLFGRPDLHHCAETVAKPKNYSLGLQRALGRDWPFGAFVLWVFDQHQRTGPARIDAVLLRMRAAGAGLARLRPKPN